LQLHRDQVEQLRKTTKLPDGRLALNSASVTVTVQSRPDQVTGGLQGAEVVERTGQLNKRPPAIHHREMDSLLVDADGPDTSGL
jgi:hypothetical protein